MLLDGGTLVEFNNVKYLSDTKQLRGYAETGKRVDLVVNKDTVVSQTVKNHILKNKETIQRFDPITKTMQPY